MSLRHRVIWTQGMFLQPHHFQQEARHHEHLVDERVGAAEPHAWGFRELVLDEGALAVGRLALLRASGVLPDGTPFAMPDHDELPPALDAPADLKGECVCLALALARPGVTEVDFGDGKADGLTRYLARTQELRDHTNASDDPEAIQTGALAVRLVRQRDLTQGETALAVVRVLEVRSDRQIVLDRAFIPAQTRIAASAQLDAVASLLHGLMQQRAHMLAARLGQLGHGVSEIADFLMLITLNRAEPLFAQFARATSAHPREFYLACLQLAGELASFAADERHPPVYPAYRHDDLQAVFAPVVEDLRRYLSAVLEQHAIRIDLVERSHGVRTATIQDLELARTGSFVLAATAQIPAEQMRLRFPTQAKLGPVERIRDLVNLQLPGVGMRSLPVAPRQLPFHAGYHYFELDTGGDLWRQLERTGNLALHVAGDFPGLDLELWAIRQG